MARTICSSRPVPGRPILILMVRMPLADPLRRLRDAQIRIAEREAPSDGHAFAHPTTQQVVRGQAADLARDIDERHLDACLGRLGAVQERVHEHRETAQLGGVLRR